MNYVIIGNGVAGINAALTIRKRDNNSTVTIISAETPYFFSRTALMYIAMGDMRLEDTEPFERNYYQKNNITLIEDAATKIDVQTKQVSLQSGDSIPYDKLLLATGSIPATFGWPGLDLEGVAFFISFQDLEKVVSYKKKAKKAVVVGGGLIGIELVEVLNSYGIDVTFVIREETFWPTALSPEEGRLIEHQMKENGVNVMMSTEFTSINGANGKVESITTGSGETIDADIVGITTGVKPNLSLAGDSNIPVNRGILVNELLETKIPDIYSAGDCVERENIPEGEPPVIAIWYSSRDMGIAAAKNMLGDNVPYSLGQWYNSAKFFEFEYTSIGHYLPVNGEEESIYLEDDKKSSSIRIVHTKGVLKGFSMIGSRWDHEVLLRFIREKRTVKYFIDYYNDGRFDPEFVAFPNISFKTISV